MLFECGVVGHWRIDHQSGALSQRNKVDKISTNVDYIINIIQNDLMQIDCVLKYILQVQ
jgi:hypothetical protein